MRCSKLEAATLFPSILSGWGWLFSGQTRAAAVEPVTAKMAVPLLVAVDFPAHVVVERFGDCIGFLRQAHGNVMLESHTTDVLAEQL